MIHGMTQIQFANNKCLWKIKIIDYNHFSRHLTPDFLLFPPQCCCCFIFLFFSFAFCWCFVLSIQLGGTFLILLCKLEFKELMAPTQNGKYVRSRWNLISDFSLNLKRKNCGQIFFFKLKSQTFYKWPRDTLQDF